MGFLSWLKIGKEVGEAISKPLEVVGEIIDSVHTSEEEKALAINSLRAIQTEVNKLEAVHRSPFVAGWRPFIGWVLGVSLAVYYIPQFVMAAVLWTQACWAAQTLIPYPVTNIAGLLELIAGMLGLAGLRTVEKMNRISK